MFTKILAIAEFLHSLNCVWVGKIRDSATLLDTPMSFMKCMIDSRTDYTNSSIHGLNLAILPP